ncbi:MAG: MFS transporter [Methanobacteriaceae archaeon]|nr:MFS transporter [Methanobacteriaceae archaeon]
MASKVENRILLLLLVGVFMGSLDIGIVGPALPAIGVDFTVSDRFLSWVFTIYILFFMIGTPLMAKLSDIYGRKTVYLVNILLFLIGSVITISSLSFEMVLMGRSIQGVGAGGIFPVANAFIGDAFPPEKRGGALGILSSVWGLTGVLGPILGALLLDFGWQWLFIINIPVSLLVILGSLYVLPRGEKNPNIQFDWKGLIILGFMVTFLAYAINQIDTNNFMTSFLSISVLPFLILSIILIPLLLKMELKAQDPLIQINLFQSREVKLLSCIMVGTGLVQAATVFVPAFVIVSFSFNASDASLMLIPVVLTMAVGAPLIGRLLDKFGSRIIILIGSSIMASGLIFLSIFSTSFDVFLFSSVLVGVGMSTTIGSPPRYIMLVETPPEDRASGQALINLITSLGQLIGGALIGAVIGSYAGRLIGYEYTFLIMGLVAFLMTLLSVGLKSKQKQLQNSY